MQITKTTDAFDEVTFEVSLSEQDLNTLWSALAVAAGNSRFHLLTKEYVRMHNEIGDVI
jgi:hypothetical protein